MNSEQIQNEIQKSTNEIEKFLKKKKRGKLIVVANEKAFEHLTKTYPKDLADGLFIVNNLEYRKLTKDTLDGQKKRHYL